MELVLTYETSYEVDHDMVDLYLFIENFIEIVKERDYGSEFTSIGIIPSIMSPKFMDSNWKERRQIWYEKKDADIRLIMDFNKFVKADKRMKEKLYVKMMIDSIMYVDSKKKKGDFDGQRLVNDLLEYAKLDWDEVKDLDPLDPNYPITRSARENNRLARERDQVNNNSSSQPNDN